MISLVLGTQWGDEGKGKLVDLLSEKADFVVRFHGGNNAGHTVIANGKKYPFHLMPSGILQPNAVGVIANGTILDLDVLLSEIKMLEEDGFDLSKKLVISDRCHLIMPYHKALDEAYENARGKDKLGTTKRGIGPCYADKVSYNGLRIYELVHWEEFEKKFKLQAKIKNEILKTFGVKPIDIEGELERTRGIRGKIIPYVKDTYRLLQDAAKSNKNILFEGAHGVMLDNDFSPYPFSTGSNVLTGAVNTGSGIDIKKIEDVWGVVKAYTSKVGEGPFPTELTGITADEIRENGTEYGTTTGRPRRVGWLDLVAVKFAVEACGINKINLTKTDVLSGQKELKVCVDYKFDGKSLPYSSCGYKELYDLTPVYKTFKGWDEDITGTKSISDLPKTCQEYIKFIEEFLGVKIAIFNTGPAREEFINT